MEEEEVGGVWQSRSRSLVIRALQIVNFAAKIRKITTGYELTYLLQNGHPVNNFNGHSLSRSSYVEIHHRPSGLGTIIFMGWDLNVEIFLAGSENRHVHFGPKLSNCQKELVSIDGTDKILNRKSHLQLSKSICF